MASNQPNEVASNGAGDPVDDDSFPEQLEDVNGDVVDFNPNDWKLIEDDEPMLGVSDIDEDDEEDNANGGGAENHHGEKEEEEEEEEEEREPIVVEHDHSIKSFDGHGGDPVYSLAINPKFPNQAVSGGGDDNAVLWDVVTGERKFHLTGHTDSISAVEFSKNGLYVATASYDSTIKIWHTQTGKCLQTLEGPDGDVEWIAWHKNADVLLAGSKDATVWMWLAPAAKFMQVFAGHEDEVTCGMFTSNGKSVVTASLDGTCRVWNPKDGTCRHQFQGYQWHEAGIVSMDVHPSKPLIATGALDGSVRLSQIRKGKILHALDREDVKQAIETVGFARTHDWLASGGLDGFIDVWDVGSGACRVRFNNDGHNVVKLQWHESQPLVISASADAVVKIWDTRSGAAVTKLTGHADVILAMDTIFGKELSYILTASDDGIVKRFDVPDLEQIMSAAVVEQPAPSSSGGGAAPEQNEQ